MIPVKYTCRQCGVYKAEVIVRFRGAEENVVQWVQLAVITEIAKDHRERSPHCAAKEISETWIPVPPGTDNIGGPVKQ